MSTKVLKARAKAAGSHYLPPDTMEFFHSVLHRTRPVSGDRIYFVTSEQLEYSDGTLDPRGWTVRVAQFEPTATGERVCFDRVSEFRQYPSLADAVTAMFAAADEWTTARAAQ